MARRTKLDEARIKRICDYVREGVTYEVAARLAGVHPATFHRWKTRGMQAKRGIYREFWEALQEADAQAEVRLLREVKKEKGGAKWIMERRWPERWGQKVDVTLEGTVFAVEWGKLDWSEADGDEAAAGDSGANASEARQAA